MNEVKKIYMISDIPYRAKIVYFYFCDRMDSEGKSWPSIKRIAADLSMSENTVRRAVKDLEKAGLLKKEYAYRDNGSHTSNRYYVK